MWKHLKTDPTLLKKNKSFKQNKQKANKKKIQTTTKNQDLTKEKLASSLYNMQAELKTNCNGLQPKSTHLGITCSTDSQGKHSPLF